MISYQKPYMKEGAQDKYSPEMKISVETLLEGWKETRKLTIDWINEIPPAILNKKLPRPGLDTFSKHICELADVEEAYTAALETGNLDFSKVTNGTDGFVADDKKILLDCLKRADEIFYRTVNNTTDWQNEISIFGTEMPKFSVIELMIRHETLHHGQFIAFGFLLNISFPQSWVDAWALPIRPK